MGTASLFLLFPPTQQSSVTFSKAVGFVKFHYSSVSHHHMVQLLCGIQHSRYMSYNDRAQPWRIIRVYNLQCLVMASANYSNL